MGAGSISIRRALRMSAASVAVGAAICAMPAFASEKSATVPVLLKVQSSCNLRTNRMDFGFPLKGAKTATATTTITASCTVGTTYRIRIDSGLHFDGSSRRMYGGQANGVVWYIPYTLSRAPAGVLPWGNALSDTVADVIPATGTRTYTVYGTADLRSVRAAEYLDTVTVVLEY